MIDASNKSTRREFLGRTASFAAATAVFPQIVPRHVIGGAGHTPPSETVYVAGIGVGGMGGIDVRISDYRGAKIAALCDVNQRQAAAIFDGFPGATKYKDYRVLLEKEKGIDAVIIGTPDHSHAIISMAAMQHGKHVYCEKPLAHTLHEIRTVTEGARSYGVATQMGNQGRSFKSIEGFNACIRSGAIGQVREVHVVEQGHSACRIKELHRLEKKFAIPEGLDWDLWLGPMPYRDYNPVYLPGTWRGWRQFGSGMLGDWVCHLVDPVFLALDLGAPTSIIAEAEGYDLVKHGETFPESTKVRYEFPARGDRPPVTVYWYDGAYYNPPRPEEIEEGEEFIPVPEAGWSNKKPFGAMVVGDAGKILYGSHGATGWRILDEEKMKDYEGSRKDQKDAEITGLSGGEAHHQNWLDACKGNGTTVSNFDYAGGLSEIAQLGNVALRMPGTELHWDAESMTFPGNPEAEEYLQIPYREGWTL